MTGQVAERITRSVRRPISVGDHEVAVGISIGKALSTGGESPAELLRRADEAMYEAKGAAG